MISYFLIFANSTVDQTVDQLLVLKIRKMNFIFRKSYLYSYLHHIDMVLSDNQRKDLYVIGVHISSDDAVFIHKS